MHHNIVVPHSGGAMLGARRAIDTQTLDRSSCTRHRAQRGRNATGTPGRNAIQNRKRNATRDS
eukprot:7012246-Lingulodinium_polyedra.AAC.1